MKTKHLLMASAIAFSLGSAGASAFFLPPGDGTTAGAKAEDQLLDWHIDNDGDGLISVGDELISVLEFGAIEDVYAANGLDPVQILDGANDELVAISTILVTGVTGLGGAGTRVDFGQSGTTSMVEMFSLGSTTDLDIGTFANCTDMVSCMAAVTDGTPWLELTIIDADDEWFFISDIGGALDPAQIAGANSSTDFGTVNFSLSAVAGTNFTGLTLGDQDLTCGLFACAGDGLALVTGNANVVGGLGLPGGLGAFARGDTDVNFNVTTVPEPGSLMLMGIGFLGMGLLGRRKSKANS